MSPERNPSLITQDTKRLKNLWKKCREDSSVGNRHNKPLTDFTIKELVAEVTSNNTVMAEFLAAYSILHQAVAIQEKSGFSKLYKKINMESKPPCNVFYLDKKIALDRHLSKATYKIYKLLKLH